jgi:transglutaminase-like putative cysteine protease
MSMRRSAWAFLLITGLATPPWCAAQTDTTASESLTATEATNPDKPKTPGLEFIEPRTYRLRLVTRIEAPDGPLTNVVAMSPFPLEWPEQKLKLLSEKVSPGAKVSEQIFKGQAGLLKLQAASIAQGEAASIERLYEVTRYRLKFNFPTNELKAPRTLPAELREQLTQPAPGIETTEPAIANLAKEIKDPGLNAWDQVHATWKWTRDNVKFQNGDFRGALFAVTERCGDCEEMSALFVGLLRLNGLQGRTVWVEGHDYPEFYLTDKRGKGHWIPCQVVGPEWFGEMIEYRPIFQKGDRFYDPLQKTLVRYVPHTLKADGKSSPRLVVDHKIIADSDINGPLYVNPK